MKIIVAVSGGVDSVVMLHRLVQQGTGVRGQELGSLTPTPNPQPPTLIVAHVDHGLRDDSAADARFVAALADRYVVSFEQTKLELDDDSEATARAGRWRFLQSVKDKYNADAIATAHHQDDVVETMLINLLRGTNRKGLTSLRQRDDVLRPLLELRKSDIYNYALEHELEWVRDSSNDHDDYLRNRIRRYLTPGLTDLQRQQLLDIYENLTNINQNLNQSLDDAAQQLSEHHSRGLRIETEHINRLEPRLQRELFATWWQQLQGAPPPDSLQLERMVAAVAEPKTGNIYQMADGMRLQINRSNFELFINDD